MSDVIKVYYVVRWGTVSIQLETRPEADAYVDNEVPEGEEYEMVQVAESRRVVRRSEPPPVAGACRRCKGSGRENGKTVCRDCRGRGMRAVAASVLVGEHGC